MGAVGPSAALCRGQWRREWGGVGREEQNGGAEVWGAVGWVSLQGKVASSSPLLSSMLENCRVRSLLFALLRPSIV